MTRGYPNGFWGNGPGNGDDTQKQRDIEAYNRSRLQFTVATSTFAGIALVGMFCSCLWFACCRHSSKTRKKGRTWATANVEGGVENNPYNYDGYMDAQGYMQMGNEGVAPYVSNPLYPNTFYGDNGLPNAYDFNEHFGMNKEGKAALYGAGGVGGLSNALGTTENGNLKDVPPSYTALFFAASDAAGLRNGTASSEAQPNSVVDSRVANIQPIHLKVTSHSAQQQKRQQQQHQQLHCQQATKNSEDDHEYEDYHKKELEQGPVSLMSVESEPGHTFNETTTNAEEKKREEANNVNERSAPSSSSAFGAANDIGRENEKKVGYPPPPPYNPGYNGYMKF